MIIDFTQEQQSEMLKCFGKAFTDALPARLAGYAEQWALTDISLIEYYSVNCLFLCCSEKYGSCVLKIFGCDFDTYIDEVRALYELNGKCGYVCAYERDEKGGALLLERIEPGTTLKLEPSLEKRIAIFADIWKNSHIAPRDLSSYKTYLETTENAAKWQSDFGESAELKRLAPLMTSVCKDLYNRYEERVLLHGDLHGDNLLKDENGTYRIVDPHARIGPRICDLGRYIADEYNDAPKDGRDAVANHIISRLSEILELPRDDIARAFFVDITLMKCWDSEDGEGDI